MFVAIASIVIVVLLLRSRLITFNGRRTTTISVVGHATTLIATFRFLLSGHRLFVASSLSIVAWMAQGVSLYLIVHALGYDLSARSAIGIYCLSILAGAVSYIPGGIGVTEAAIVLLLTASGIGKADAMFAALICRSLTLWIAVGIGLVSMARLTFTRNIDEQISEIKFQISKRYGDS